MILDVDGTLHRGSLPAKWHEKMMTRMNRRNEAYNKYCAVRTSYRQGIASSDDHKQAFIQSWLDCIVHTQIDTAIEVGEEVIQEEGLNNFIFTTHLVRSARASGFKVIALSSCPQFLLDIFNTNIGMDYCLGARWEFDRTTNLFTGKVSNPDIFQSRGTLFQRAISDIFRGVTVDLGRSFGIGDTLNDVSWLDQLGSCIAFNPDKPLTGYARKHSYKYSIITEHKDVVMDASFPEILCPIELAQLRASG